MDTPCAPLRVRELRVRHGMSQTELAEAAGIDLRTLRAVELDPDTGGVKLATLHSIARVLGVTTGALFTPPHVDQPRPARRDVHNLRMLLEPPPVVSDAPEQASLRALFRDADLYVRDNDLVNAELALLTLIPRARNAVDAATGAADQRAARKVLVQGYDRMATLLNLLNEADLANKALDLLEQVAREAGEPVWSASGVTARAWSLLRQGDFAGVIQQAEAAAHEIEPDLGTRDEERLAVWGYLMVRISGAAARDNRPELAVDSMRRARAAAELIGRDVISNGHSFGLTIVAIRGVENAVVAGDYGKAAKLARSLPRDGRVLPRDKYRHALDIADIHLEHQRVDRALELIVRLREDAPMWLQAQPYAMTLAAKLIRTSKRRLSPEMRELADFLDVPA